MKEQINTPFIQNEEQRKILMDSMKGRLEYTLMNDFLTKYTLQNDLYALKGLLAALMQVELDEITDIDILNPIELADAINDKSCILDVKLELNQRDIINIEIQSMVQDFWPERSITYLARCFDQLGEGQGYREIKPCIHIGILSSSCFRKTDPRYSDEFYSEYQMMNIKNHKRYCGKFIIPSLTVRKSKKSHKPRKYAICGTFIMTNICSYISPFFVWFKIFLIFF